MSLTINIQLGAGMRLQHGVHSESGIFTAQWLISHINSLKNAILGIVVAFGCTSPGLCFEIPSKLLELTKNPDDQIILGERWLPLTLISGEKDNWKVGDVVVGAVSIGRDSVRISSNRYEMNYRIRIDSELRYPKRRRSNGCEINRTCNTHKIDVTEYTMDCLAKQYRPVRFWIFYFNQSGFENSMGKYEVGRYTSELGANVPWRKTWTEDVHGSVERALCTTVLPTRKN